MKLRGAVLLGVLGLLMASGPLHGQPFERNVELLNLGGQLVPDMEFDHLGYQITWQDDEGNLWVAPVDSKTGDFQMDGAKMIATGLAPKTGRLGTHNGPEWVYTNEGSQILYTLQVGGAGPSNWRIGVARKRPGVPPPGETGWNAGPLDPPIVGGPPDGTKVPGDSDPLFFYYNFQNRTVGWGPLKNPADRGVAPFQFSSQVSWAIGEHLIVSSVKFSGVDQIVLFDPARPRKIAQMTFDRRFHKIKPQMWHAPEYGNELVFFALERRRNAAGGSPQIGVYRLINGEWTKIKTIVPPSNPRLVDSPEAFVHNGKSYISFMAMHGTSQSEGTETWIAGIEEQDFYRKVADPSDGLPDGAPLQSSDPEYLITESGVFIYMSQERGSKVYRASTGL
jgi:hypothetical protein